MKIIIDNQTPLSDEWAAATVSWVIRRGRISDNGRSYCFVTYVPAPAYVEGQIVVYAKRNKTSDTFRLVGTRAGTEEDLPHLDLGMGDKEEDNA